MHILRLLWKMVKNKWGGNKFKWGVPPIPPTVKTLFNTNMEKTSLIFSDGLAKVAYTSFRTKYSRADQVKFVEDSL